MSFTRRQFLATTAAAAGTVVLPRGPSRAKAKYTRYDATTPEGKAMLKSYAVAVEAMLKLPPDNPHNWFRNAFVHFMDCPHGNWWFYVWHRGYVGFFEETVRRYSGNPDFAFPYWDWTNLPRIPEEMFDGVLTPRDDAYRPYTQNLAIFTDFIRKPLHTYYDSLTPAQKHQQKLRGFGTFEDLWQNMLACDSKGQCSAADQSFAETDRARYLTRDNPDLDAKTAAEASPQMISDGLAPVEFYNSDPTASFTSAKTPSHNTMPPNGSVFSILEGHPHNKIHNFIGGVGSKFDPGPYGNMTNNLSPVDPVFFLHHSNMDRLWKVWTDKQKAQGLPILPTDPTLLAEFKREPFLFYVRADGTHVLDGKAEDYLDTERFDYDYGPVRGQVPIASAAIGKAPKLKAAVAGGVAKAKLSAAKPQRIVATLKVTRSADPSAPRDFDVLVGAPADVTHVEADSPYYAGSISFFGPPMHHMAEDAEFVVPLPDRVRDKLAASNGQLEIRLVPTYGRGVPPLLKGVTLSTL